MSGGQVSLGQLTRGQMFKGANAPHTCSVKLCIKAICPSLIVVKVLQ